MEAPRPLFNPVEDFIKRWGKTIHELKDASLTPNACEDYTDDFGLESRKILSNAFSIDIPSLGVSAAPLNMEWKIDALESELKKVLVNAESRHFEEEREIRKAEIELEKAKTETLKELITKLPPLDIIIGVLGGIWGRIFKGKPSLPNKS
jgi:hypothetical protein